MYLKAALMVSEHVIPHFYKVVIRATVPAVLQAAKFPVKLM